MSLGANKTIVRRFFDAVKEHDLDVLDELFAPDYVDRTFQLRGGEILKQFVIRLVNAFLDVLDTIEDIIAEGDKVWVWDYDLS